MQVSDDGMFILCNNFMMIFLDDSDNDSESEEETVAAKKSDAQANSTRVCQICNKNVTRMPQGANCIACQKYVCIISILWFFNVLYRLI